MALELEHALGFTANAQGVAFHPRPDWRVLAYTIAQRRREIGILKATGWQTDQILLRGLVESLALGLIGSLVGAGTGVLVQLALPQLVASMLPVEVEITHDPAAVAGADQLVILGVPSRAMRDAAKQVAPHVHAEAAIVSVAKGIEHDTLLRMTQVIAEVVPSAAARVAAMSGPNLALEIARGIEIEPGTSATSLRVRYTHPDPVWAAEIANQVARRIVMRLCRITRATPREGPSNVMRLCGIMIGPIADTPFAEGKDDALDGNLRYRLISERAYARYCGRGYADGGGRAGRLLHAGLRLAKGHELGAVPRRDARGRGRHDQRRRLHDLGQRPLLRDPRAHCCRFISMLRCRTATI